MKSHLIYTFTRLALVALLISGSGLSARGHDLPQDRNLPPAASANCFTSFSVQSLPFSDGTSPWLDALQNIWTSANQSALLLQESVHHLSPNLDGSAQLSANTLAIHAPDPGTAPRPRLTSTQSISHTAANHSVEPLLVQQPAAGEPPRPRIAHSRQTSFDLASTLATLDYWQCCISQALYDQDALQQAIAAQTQTTYRLLDQTLANLATRVNAVPERKIPIAGPQFVVFDTAAGQQILLTVAQARQWQFAAPAADLNAAQWFNSAVIPLQRQALATLSKKLEMMGNQLIQLSRTISTLAPMNVAVRSTGKEWK